MPKYMHKVNGDLFSYLSHILVEFCPQRATYKTFLNKFSLVNYQNFIARFLKLISTHPIHIVHWRNFQFKNCQCND